MQPEIQPAHRSVSAGGVTMQIALQESAAVPVHDHGFRHEHLSGTH
jgi:hypothetical protein